MADEAEDQLADVVPLHPGFDMEDDDRPLTTGPRPESFCQHRRTTLESEARKVVCRDCNRELDPFDVLTRLAREPERWIEHRKAAEARARRVQANLDDLLREERNAKARKRRREAGDGQGEA